MVREAAGRSLKDQCVETALEIIRDDGLENLSLREVARRLGVSHGAPYKHFPSRDHILAEVVARVFADFATHLDTRRKTGVPPQDMAEMGRTYIAYALNNPLKYRLMFGTALPDPEQHPEMMRQARHAFSLLRENLADLHASHAQTVSQEQLDLDALFVWSTMHGISGILSGDAIGRTGVAPARLTDLPAHVIRRVGDALGIKEA